MYVSLTAPPSLLSRGNLHPEKEALSWNLSIIHFPFLISFITYACIFEQLSFTFVHFRLYLNDLFKSYVYFSYLHFVVFMQYVFAIHFIAITVFHCMYMSQLIHSLTNEHHFQFCIMMNSTDKKYPGYKCIRIPMGQRFLAMFSIAPVRGI